MTTVYIILALVVTTLDAWRAGQVMHELRAFLHEVRS